MPSTHLILISLYAMATFASSVASVVSTLSPLLLRDAPASADDIIAALPVAAEADDKASSHEVLTQALRQILEQSMSGSSGALPTAQPFAIVDLSIRCALTERGEAHTPFQLLYDLFDAQPIAACEGIWGFLEERSVELTDSKFIPSDAKNTKSKLLLLRIANSLLRRLSQERDTVFCGRIQMFLAQAFPLAERSAMNVRGEFNTDNVTSFEDEEDFVEGRKEAATGTGTGAGMGAGMGASGGADEDDDAADAPIDYNTYRTFWMLQSFFVDPSKAVASPEAWKSVTGGLGVMFDAFEGHAFSDADLKAAADDGRKGDASNDEEAFYCTKFLTNSRLLRLQLRDPSLRRHVLLQSLILFQFLSAHKAAQGGSKLSPSPQPTIAASKKRALALLRKTPSRGDKFADSVEVRGGVWVVGGEVGRWKEEGGVGFRVSVNSLTHTHTHTHTHTC